MSSTFILTDTAALKATMAGTHRWATKRAAAL